MDQLPRARAASHMAIPSIAGKALAVASLLALAACAGDYADALKLECPQVAIMADADQITLTGPNGAPASSAYMENFTGSCGYGDEGNVDVEMAVLIEGERPRGAAPETVSYPYFVAVVGPDRQILAREAFEAKIDYANQDRYGKAVESLQQVIPLNGRQGKDYKVLIGFQLTREQLDANRGQR